MPDAVEVDGVVHPLPGSVRPRAAAWWRDGVCVARTDPRGGEARSELWWVGTRDGAVRLLTRDRERLLGLVVAQDRLFVQTYADSDDRAPHPVRVLEVEGVDHATDAVPALSGSVHQVIPMPRGPGVVWSEDPNFSHHLLFESDEGWEDVAPGLRVAGLGQRADSGRVVMPAYDGIRAGLAVIEPDRRAWRWLLNDPEASFLPFTVGSDGKLAAIRRPVAGVPALVSVNGNATREVAPLPDLRVPPARIWSWDGPAGTLEGLRVTPSEGGPWPMVIDVHGGPNRAAAVRTPMLLLYGEDGCPAQGQAWRDALSRAGVPVELWIYPGGHLPAPEVVEDIYRRAAAWFRRWL